MSLDPSGRAHDACQLSSPLPQQPTRLGMMSWYKIWWHNCWSVCRATWTQLWQRQVMDRKQCCIGHMSKCKSKGCWPMGNRTVLVINPQKRQKQLFFSFSPEILGWVMVLSMSLQVSFGGPALPICPSAQSRWGALCSLPRWTWTYRRWWWTFEDGLLTPNEIIPMRYGSRDQYYQDFMYFHEFSSV